MNIVFGIVRQLVVDDIFELLNIQSARGHIGGHQRANLALLKIFQCFLTRTLGFIAVDRLGLDAVLGHLLG